MKKLKKRIKKSKKAFTLIELLAVIVVLGIILALTIQPILNALGGVKEKAIKTYSSRVLQKAKEYVALESALGSSIPSILGKEELGLDDSQYSYSVIYNNSTSNYQVYISDNSDSKISFVNENETISVPKNNSNTEDSEYGDILAKYDFVLKAISNFSTNNDTAKLSFGDRGCISKSGSGSYIKIAYTNGKYCIGIMAKSSTNIGFQSFKDSLIKSTGCPPKYLKAGNNQCLATCNNSPNGNKQDLVCS